MSLKKSQSKLFIQTFTQMYSYLMKYSYPGVSLSNVRDLAGSPVFWKNLTISLASKDIVSVRLRRIIILLKESNRVFFELFVKKKIYFRKLEILLVLT